MIITFDGPAASGKSTIAKEISLKLNGFYLYSGLLYRAYAYILKKKNIPLDKENIVEKEINKITLLYTNKDYSPCILYDMNDITRELHSELIALAASEISGYKNVRSKIATIQRSMGVVYPVVIADGRDCGVTIFPGANLKFYLTATITERYTRGKSRGLSTSQNSIQRRDIRDLTRKIDPLKAAYDSIILDTTHMKKEEVILYIQKFLH